MRSLFNAYECEYCFDAERDCDFGVFECIHKASEAVQSVVP